MDDIALLAALSLLIMLSPFLSRLTGFPSAVVEISLGCVAAFFGFFSGESQLFDAIAQVGFLYLMFLAGMEVDLREFAALEKSLWRRIALFFALLYALAVAITYGFSLSLIYIAALPTISVGMIMALIHAQGRSEWLGFALTLGIIGELLSICSLTVLSGLVAQKGEFNAMFLETMLILLVVLLSVWLAFYFSNALFWWFPRLKKLIMPDHGSMDEDVRVAMALFFILVASALYLDLELVLGAFVAGMFIANFFKHKEELPHKLSSLGFGFLVPIFFIYVGGTLDLTLIARAQVVVVAALIVIAMIAIRLAVSIAVFGSIFGFAERLKIGLVESMPLTFLVAIATIGRHGDLLTQDEYSSFILASMAQAVAIMLLVKWIDKKGAKKALA